MIKYFVLPISILYHLPISTVLYSADNADTIKALRNIITLGCAKQSSFVLASGQLTPPHTVEKFWFMMHLCTGASKYWCYLEYSV